jgi:AraC-like DNA-binding protein
MADRAKDLTIRDIDWSSVPVASLTHVLNAAGRSALRSDAVPPGDPDERVPYRRVAELYEAAAQWTGDPWFGLHFGAAVDARSYELAGYIALSGPTLGDAFDMIARYLPLWTTGGGFQIERSHTALEIVWSYADPSAPPWRHDCEMAIMALASIGGLLRADAWRPREVHFRHPPPSDSSEHPRLLRAPARFDMPSNRIVCAAAVSAIPIPTADPVLHKLLRSLADQVLAARPSEPSLLEATAAAIVHRLPTGDAQLSGVARMLGLSARTLQRRLIANGTTFRELITAVRRDRATHALVHSERPIAEIATQLGYGSPTELHRAFHSWVGTGPAAYRRAHRRTRT